MVEDNEYAGVERSGKGTCRSGCKWFECLQVWLEYLQDWIGVGRAFSRVSRREWEWSDNL